MIRLLRHTSMFQASLFDVHHWLERRDLDRVPFFQSLDSVHCTRRSTTCLHHQRLHLQLVLANLAAGPCELAAGPCERGGTGTLV